MTDARSAPSSRNGYESCEDPAALSCGEDRGFPLNLVRASVTPLADER